MSHNRPINLDIQRHSKIRIYLNFACYITFSTKVDSVIGLHTHIDA